MPPKRKNHRVTKPATTATTQKSQPTGTGTGTGAATNGVSAIKRRRSSVQAGKPSTSRLQPSEPLHMTTRGAAKQASSQGTSPAAAPSPSSTALGDGNNSRRSSLNGIGNGRANTSSFADEDVAVASTADSGSRRNSQQMGSFVSQLPDVQTQTQNQNQNQNQQEPAIAAPSPPKTAGRKRKASGAGSNNNNAHATTTTTTTKTSLTSQMDSDQSERQPRRKKRKTANTPPEPADAPPELTDDASTAPASPEEPIPEVAPSDTLQNVLPASDVPAKRRLPGRRRQPHANINVEVNLRRQLNLKMSYRKLAKEHKAVLEELAKRTLHNLHENPKFHKEAPEYDHVMSQLEQTRQKRLKEIEDERQIKLAQLERVLLAQEHIQREQYINRFREFQENYILQCKYRMKQIERQMRAEQGEATDDEEYVVEATHMAFPLHDEDDVLGSRYASRSRAYVETERMLHDDEMRARLNERRISFVAKNPDHDNDDTIPDSFGNFSGPEAERDEAVAHYNLTTLLDASTAMEVDGEQPAPTEVEVEPSKVVPAEEPVKAVPSVEVPKVIPNEEATALFLLASLSTERPIAAEKEQSAEEAEKQEGLVRELSSSRVHTPKVDDALASTESTLVQQNEDEPVVEADLVRSPGKRADSTGRKSPSQPLTDLPAEKQVAGASDVQTPNSPPRLSVDSSVQPSTEHISEVPAVTLSPKPKDHGRQEEESADYIPLDVGSDHEDDYLRRADMPVENGTSPKRSHSEHTAGHTPVVHVDDGEPMDVDNDAPNGQTSTQYMTTGSKSQSLERIEKAWGHGAIDELVKGRVGITQSDLSNPAVLDCLAQIATSEQEVTVADFIEAAIWDQEKNGPWSLGSRVPHVGDIQRVQRRLEETAGGKKIAAFKVEDAEKETSTYDDERGKLPSEKPRPEDQHHLVNNQSRTMSTPVNPMDVLDKLRALARDKTAGEEAAESKPKSPRSPNFPAGPSAHESGQHQAPAAGPSQREVVDLAPQPTDSAFYSGSTAGHHRDRLSMSAIMNDDRHEDELARRRSLPTFHEAEARISRHDPSLPLSRMRAMVRNLQDDARRPQSRDASASEEHRSTTSLSMEQRPEERRRLPWERDSRDSAQTTTYQTPAPTASRDVASPQDRPAGLAQQARRDSYGRDTGPNPPTSWDPSRRASESAPSTTRPSLDRPELGNRTAGRTPPSTASTPSHPRPPPGLAHPLAYPTPKRPRHSTSSSSSLPAKPPVPASQPPVNFRFAHYEPAPSRPASYQSGPPPPAPTYSSPAHPYGPPAPTLYHPTAPAPMSLPPTYMGIQQLVAPSGSGYVPPPGSFQAPPPPPPLQHHQQPPPRAASPPAYPPMRIAPYAEQQHVHAHPHQPSPYTHMGPPPPQQGYAYVTSPPQGHASPASVSMAGSPVMVAGGQPQPQQQQQGQGQGEPRPRRQYRAYHAPETKFRAYQGPRGPRG